MFSKHQGGYNFQKKIDDESEDGWVVFVNSYKTIFQNNKTRSSQQML